MNRFRIAVIFSKLKRIATPTAFQRRFFNEATEAARVARYMASSQKHTKRDSGRNRP